MFPVDAMDGKGPGGQVGARWPVWAASFAHSLGLALLAAARILHPMGWTNVIFVSHSYADQIKDPPNWSWNQIVAFLHVGQRGTFLGIVGQRCGCKYGFGDPETWAQVPTLPHTSSANDFPSLSLSFLSYKMGVIIATTL